MVQVIDERPFLAVVKEYPHHAKTTFQGRVLLFNDLTPSPSTMLPVHHDVANFQIQPPAHFLFYPVGYRNGNDGKAASLKIRESCLRLNRSGRSFLQFDMRLALLGACPCAGLTADAVSRIGDGHHLVAHVVAIFILALERLFYQLQDVPAAGLVTPSAAYAFIDIY